jgi:hypothetical protein
MTVLDIYRDALSQLEIRLEASSTSGQSLLGRVEASGEMGVGLLAKLGLKSSVERSSSGQTLSELVGHDVTDLRFIADIIRASGRRLVVEDFHFVPDPSDGRLEGLGFVLNRASRWPVR